MKAVALAMLLFLSACAHSIHQVHTSDFSPGAPVEAGDMVSGYGEQFVVFWFANETNYVDQAYRKLMAACPTGVITGITTQLSTSLGFFSWTNKALMQGLCIQPKAKKS